MDLLLQAIVAEAERQAQYHEEALSRASTTEQHLQQRLMQLEAEVQAWHPPVRMVLRRSYSGPCSLTLFGSGALTCTPYRPCFCHKNGPCL